ncbi:MAG: hypothetical protein JW767_01510 [Thermoleophilia bacterium]|nr:hypothetical protein [Thermoleophilia bacterium]
MRHKALASAYCMHETAKREAIGIDVGETEAFRRESLGGLRSRSLTGVAAALEGTAAKVARLLAAARGHVGRRRLGGRPRRAAWSRLVASVKRDRPLRRHLTQETTLSG